MKLWKEQEPRETVDSCVTKIKMLAASCEFGVIEISIVC